MTQQVMIDQVVETFNRPVDMHKITVLLKCTFKNDLSTSVQERLHTVTHFVWVFRKDVK